MYMLYCGEHWFVGLLIDLVVIYCFGFVVQFARTAADLSSEYGWTWEVAGKAAIAWYIGTQGLESTYGAAASIVVLLVWVYYSAQIVLFGAELTHAYAERIRKGQR